jgi:hypothetical protein
MRASYDRCVACHACAPAPCRSLRACGHIVRTGPRTKDPRSASRAKRDQTPEGARRAFENAVVSAKLDGLHFHDLRHSFASWFVMLGGRANPVSRLLRRERGNLCRALISRPELEQAMCCSQTERFHYRQPLSSASPSSGPTLRRRPGLRSAWRCR